MAARLGHGLADRPLGLRARHHGSTQRGEDRAGDAVRLMYVTTAFFTGPAGTYAGTQGMSTLDGDQLAQLLLSEGIGVDEETGGAPRVSRTNLLSWATGSGPVQTRNR